MLSAAAEAPLLWFAACSSVEAPPRPVPAPVTPAIESAYVVASLLRLRVAPDPEAAYSPLAINTRVRVLERKGEWVRVIAPDGRAGWVRADFLGAAPLRAAEAHERAVAAADPAEKVAWAEREAALSPADSGAIDALVKAYRAAGREEDAARIEATLRLEEADRFDQWFASSREESARITAALGRAHRAEELIAVWRDARDLTAAMGEPLSRGYDEVQHQFIDGDPTPMLKERMPWATVVIYAEGTVPALELLPSAWVTAASRTDEKWDDAFFALVTRAWETASARGWTAWQKRTWDYGGCSPFGDGHELHLGLLRQTDALAGVTPAQPWVDEVRAAVLADIVDKPATDDFPYCTAPGQPTPLDGLLAEAQAILAQVALTDAERARIVRRLDENFGR